MEMSYNPWFCPLQVNTPEGLIGLLENITYTASWKQRNSLGKKYKVELGYKKVTHLLNISQSTVKSIIPKMERDMAKTANLPRQGNSSKMAD